MRQILMFKPCSFKPRGRTNLALSDADLVEGGSTGKDLYNVQETVEFIEVHGHFHQKSLAESRRPWVELNATCHGLEVLFHVFW